MYPHTPVGQHEPLRLELRKHQSIGWLFCRDACCMRDEPTWMVALSPSSLMISPIRLSAPTRMSSYMAAPDMLSAMTTGPDTLRTYLQGNSVLLSSCRGHAYTAFRVGRQTYVSTDLRKTCRHQAPIRRCNAYPAFFSEVFGSLAILSKLSRSQGPPWV